MSINIKKYTKGQMAKMVEEVVERCESLKSENADLVEKLRKEKAEKIALRNDLMTKMHSNAVLTEKLDQMNGEAITRENEIANLKADADVLRNKLADTEAALGRANAKLTYSVTEKNELQIKLTAAEGALGKMNDKIVRCEAYSRTLRGDVNKLQLEKIDAGLRANYAESHPWRNLWAWLKHKLKMA